MTLRDQIIEALESQKYHASQDPRCVGFDQGITTALHIVNTILDSEPDDALISAMYQAAYRCDGALSYRSMKAACNAVVGRKV